jgi:protein-S-isoprenylcysteine O-methyltransferase Ste14
MSSEPASKPNKAPEGILPRGVYKNNTAGTATFVGLRTASPLLQYSILRYGVGAPLLHKVGLRTLPAGPPNTGIFLDGLGLSPYRLILFSMTTISTLRQIGWKLGIYREEFAVKPAVAISLFNLVMDTVGTVAFTLSATSASLTGSGTFPQTPLIIGTVLFLVGSAIETGADIQRKLYKDDIKNAGTLYTGGLWKYSRHANYFGYLLWRTGFGMACGGYTFGAVAAAFFSAHFVTTGIPENEGYTSEKVSTH